MVSKNQLKTQNAIRENEREALFMALRELAKTLGSSYMYNGPQTALQEQFIEECYNRLCKKNDML